MSRAAVLVLGIGDVASAVAHLLHRAGFAVAIHAGPEPPLAHRRRMAFADAWYDGRTHLAGVSACMAPLLKMPEPGCIPVFAEAFQTVLGVQSFAVIVDARMRKRAQPDDLRGVAPLTIGVGPGFLAATNVDLAIETAWGDRLGHVVRHGPTLALTGEPRQIVGVGRERLVYARTAGRFGHQVDIGTSVAAGEVLALLDDVPVRSPIAGTLRGIVRSGVQVPTATKLLEIDPRPPERAVFQGLGDRPRQIAEGVLEAILAS